MTPPRLIAPAGNLEKLKTACLYGADGVYFGLNNLNLRAASDNFTYDEAREGLEFAKKFNAETYFLLNSYMTSDDFSLLREIVENFPGVSKFVVSDIGTIRKIREITDIPIILSTQASCANHMTAEFYKKIGVNQVVLAREVSIDEALKIKEQTDLDIEMFVHGAMCMGWSGNCMISTYTAGRDSNRGGCSHACRFHYEFSDSDTFKDKESFLCSKDLNGMRLLPELVNSSVNSLKIEGRMKSLLYLATIVKAYREAIDLCVQEKNPDLENIYKETLLIPRRDYCEGFLKGYNSENVCDDANANSLSGAEFIGVIKKVYQDGFLILVKNGLKNGDDIEVLTFKGENLKIKADNIFDALGENIAYAPANKIVFIKGAYELSEGCVVRKVTCE